MIWQIITSLGNIINWIAFGIVFSIIFQFFSKGAKKRMKWILTFLLPSIYLARFLVFCAEIFNFNECFMELCTKDFPSGHSSVIFAFATAAFLHFRNFSSFLLFPLAILVAYSRIVLGFHSLLDIVGGSVIGIASSIFLFFLKRKLKFLAKT